MYAKINGMIVSILIAAPIRKAVRIVIRQVTLGVSLPIGSVMKLSVMMMVQMIRQIGLSATQVFLNQSFLGYRL